jgi:hypothetical protein
MQHRSLISFVLASVAGVAACGDDKAAPDAFNTPTDGSSQLVDAPPTTVSKAVVVAGDFTTGHPGKMSTITATGTPTIVTDVAAAGAVDDDPVLRRFGGDLIVVNRGANNVTLVDDTTFAVLDQVSTGSNSNPQDVTIADGKLYVPIYGGSGVAVIDRGSGSDAGTKIINLSVDDPDGKPNCASAYAVGTDVYVTCQLLDDGSNFVPRGSGEVFVIDSTTDTIRTSFRMQTENPLGLLESSNDGNLVVGTTVGFGSGSGCVEKITTGAAPTSACIVQNSTLGGYASRVQFLGTANMFIAVENFPTGTLDFFDGTTVTPATGTSEVIGDVAICPSGNVVASDTATPAGIRVFSESGELTTSAQAVGIPPTSGHGLVCY